MLKNYILTAWRNLLKNRVFSIINLVGFSLGVACTILIFAYVWDELHFDQYHEHTERTYRVALERSFPNRTTGYATTPAPLGPTIAREIPEVEAAARVFEPFTQVRIKIGDRSFFEENVYAADSTFFDIFSYESLEGSLSDALKQPRAAVLTDHMKTKLFGKNNALGELIEVGDTSLYRVTAVIENPPKQSHFKFDMLLSFHSFPFHQNTFWGSYSLYNYIRLKDPQTKQAVETKMPTIIEQYMAPQVEAVLGNTYQEYVDAGNIHNYYLQRIDQIHTSSNLERELTPNADIRYIYLFGIIAVMILFIASFNFMNLATANAVKRGKEVAVRKVLGSLKSQLVFQFLSESVMITAMAVSIALLGAWLLLPYFNELSGKELAFSDFSGVQVVAFLTLLTIVVGILSGLYPAFFISGFDTLRIFKGALKLSSKKFGLRNILITFQFAASLFLVISTVFILRQMDYMMNQKLGFAKERMVIVNTGNNLGSNYRAFLDDLQNQTYIAEVSASIHTPGRRSGGGTFQAIGIPATERFLFDAFNTDYSFAKTYDLELVSGRFFNSDLQSDTASIVINETCAKMVGWDDPIGQRILVTNAPFQHRIVGVVKDFHQTSLHEEISPMVFFGIHPDNVVTAQPPLISVRLAAQADLRSSLDQLETKWAEWVPGELFRYSFLDDEFDALYREEQKFADVFTSFSILAISIALVGVIGLSLFISAERTKEIGIRKVLGANIPQIMALLSIDFLILIGIANLVIWPLAYYSINQWLSNYPYATTVNVLWFIAIGLAFASTIIFTISFITFKAASVNPVRSIKYE